MRVKTCPASRNCASGKVANERNIAYAYLLYVTDICGRGHHSY